MTNIHKKGFTLVELMIVLAVVAILVAMALPSFRDTIRKSRRSDAMNANLDIHLSQERWRANNIAYATLVELGLANPLISPDGYYSLTVPVNTATTYTILGTAQGDQVNDSCGNFTLAFVAGVITKSASGDEGNERCWKR